MMEIWKTIEDYPEYQVSNLGNVRSITREYIDSMGRKYHKIGQIIKLKEQKGKDGYVQIMVSICSKGKMHRLIVSRLVAKAFIPNPNNYPQVNHKNEDSTDNRVENLEWCTCKYNINYKDLVKRRSVKKSMSIDIYDNELKYIETLCSGVEVSKKYNISKSSVSQCCHEKVKYVKGYHLEFHKE